MSGRAGAAIAIVVIVIVALIAPSRISTLWSNRCDPDNSLFKRLKSDPVVSFHAIDERFTIEGSRPDNSFICQGPSLTETHFGDPSLLYPELRTNLLHNGWVEDLKGYQNPDASRYRKDAGVGAVMTVNLRRFLFWVDVRLWIRDAHMGESGFQ
ncbi:MAG: hypothetical protein NVS9B11_08980 [Candidatus Dormibacteraceae bacterium]